MKKLLPFILFLPLSVIGQSDLKKGLIAYYPISGNLKDSSGFNGHAREKNIVFTTDRFDNPGSACYFNGVNAYATLPQNQRFNFSRGSNFSISVWISPDQGNKWPAQAIIVKSPPHYDFTQSVWDYGIYLLNYRGMAGYGYNHILNSKTQFSSKICWYNIIVTYSAGNWKMFINGQEEANSGYMRNTIDYDPESVLVLGRKGASDGDYYKGKMDDIRIYNRLLTAEEINLLSANPCNKPTCPEDKVPARFSYVVSNCSTVSLKLNSGKTQSLAGVKWFFGDGKTSSVLTPKHTYKIGEFEIKAITTSKSGCYDTFSQKVRLLPFKSGFSYSEEGLTGSILFKAVSNGPRYTWDLGDSTIIRNESMVRHTYSSSNEYIVRLNAENNSGCKDTVVHRLLIKLPENKIPVPETTNMFVPAKESFNPLIEKRETEIFSRIEVEQDSIQVALYDNGVVDGDSITLIYDGEIILSKKMLQAQPLILKIAVPTDQTRHMLQMFAENQGTIPPNTALMIIRDGEKKHEIYISSTTTTNGAVQFIRQQ